MDINMKYYQINDKDIANFVILEKFAITSQNLSTKNLKWTGTWLEIYFELWKCTNIVFMSQTTWWIQISRM